VVRTERDGATPSCFQVDSKTLAKWSTRSRTGMPRFSAVSTIFSPCWSLPETEYASMPSWRFQRTSMSATTVV
jgi:hypothetical protein